jgi:serine/threonine protein kinase
MSSTNDPLIGSRIREYEILEVLGKGGMGAVYRARHAYLEEDRAIKLIEGRLTESGSLVERFIREAKILTKLRHPNLVQLYEFGVLENGSFFMVMELINGESVYKRMKRLGRIPIVEAVRIIREAACGLQCAHQNGIIHRDLSPDNFVLLTDQDSEVTKVIDFGIAKPLFENSLELTASNLFVGKPEYCSPEQCSFPRPALDGRSDIYSLAITFYQMLTGTLPFYSKSAQGYFLKHTQEIPAPPSSHFPPGMLPDPLDRLILKALAKLREERQESISEFIAELDRSVAEHVPPQMFFSEPEPGEIFAGRYLIEKKSGQGEMGMVFKATDKILEIPVALKMISFDSAEDAKTLARFKREVILARKVSHPNVCRVYDIGEIPGVHYVSMEFVEGRTLSDFMRAQSRLSLDLAMPILHQILWAVRETHHAGIIHRDLKPQNILIDQGHHLKIMDFGISISSDFSRITQTGALMGTPHYMAPEVFEEKPVDQRADLYSLGVLMFALFTGRLPFDGPTPVAVIYAHLKGDPPKPSEIVPSFPPGLERIILKALQKDPALRYQSADELLQDLETFAQPPADPKDLNEEQLAHKYFAERHYAQTIKIVRKLLKKNPDNPKWQRLLRSAVAEKAKKDLRRIKTLINKGNLFQAQFILERIGKLHPEGTSVTKHLERMQEQLIAAKEKAVNQYLEDAEGLLMHKDYLAAMARLESAWHLKPNDPVIIQMQQRIQTAQEEEFARKYDGKLAEARSHLADGDEEQAFVILETVLEEYPTHRDARLLRDQIVESRWQKVQEQIQQGLELAVQPLSFCDFEMAAELLQKLQNEVEIDSCSAEIDKMRKAVLSLHSAFINLDFESVRPILRQLISKDRFGWLEPHQSMLTAIEDTAAEKLEQRNKEVRDALTVAKELVDSEEYLKAVDRLDELLSRRPHQDVAEFRWEILNLYRDAKLREAQTLTYEMDWQRAVDCWKEILLYFPEDEEVRAAVAGTEDHLSKESELQSELLRHLKHCYSLIIKKQLTEAQTLLERMLEHIQPGYRLIEIEKQIQKLQTEILRQIQMQKRHMKGVSQALQIVKKLYREKAYPEAMEKLSSILEEDVVPEEALEVKEAIEKAVQQQQLAQRFRWAFQKGKEFFENRRWQKAIDFWKKAAIIADDPILKGWIVEAEQRLKKERQIRLSIIAMLAEIDQLIFYGNFEDARQKLERCIRALSRDYFLEDLAEQVESTANKLEQEIQKEQTSRSLLQNELEETALLYQQRLYPQALERLDRVLEQHPEMEAAMQLRAQIESAEAENRNVLETIRAIVKLVVRKEFKQLPPFLIRLRDSSANTPYVEDGASIVEELPLLALEIESGDVAGMRQRLDKLFSRSLLFLQYRRVFENFADSLETEKRAEGELEIILENGLEAIRNGHPDAAATCLQEFDEILPGARSGEVHVRILDPVDRTMIVTDPELRISESELQSLEQELKRNELRQLLERAAGLLERGEKTEARSLFERALQIEPGNVIAKEGLKSL